VRHPTGFVRCRVKAGRASLVASHASHIAGYQWQSGKVRGRGAENTGRVLVNEFVVWSDTATTSYLVSAFS